MDAAIGGWMDGWMIFAPIKPSPTIFVASEAPRRRSRRKRRNEGKEAEKDKQGRKGTWKNYWTKLEMNHLDPQDAIFLVDAFLDECKVDQHGQTKGGSKQSTKLCVWLDEDKDGQPLPKRSRAGEKRKRDSASVSSASVKNSLIQDVRDLLGSGAEQPFPSDWRNRQTTSLENWTVMRPFMVNNMLSSEKPKEGVCHHCGHKAAVVMCRDCLPRSLYCTTCDLSTHETLVLHNRASMVEGFFRHLPPSTFVKQHEGNSPIMKKVVFKSQVI
ncbi:hypothetical protein QQF64_002765 [Cirrhinus molitorella]|uniref:B box-type domain-containing protein n=1 Tax=Cirrhinus molitorella TaxID=172907 RepID=A0ABR3MR23_9TELE